MTKDRQLYIAMAIIKVITREKTSLKSLGGDLKEESVKTGIPADELKEFIGQVVQEIVDEAFAGKNKKK